MNTHILEYIKSRMDKKKTIVFSGPDGSKSLSYVFDIIKSTEKEEYNYVFLDAIELPNIDILNLIIKQKQFLGVKTIFIINRIDSCKNYQAIINYIFNENNEYCFATSLIDVVRESNDASTKIRGRVETIYIPPILYDDYIEDNDGLNIKEYLEQRSEKNFVTYCDGYKYKDVAARLHEIICKNVGYETTYNFYYNDETINKAISINTFESVINWMLKRGFIYVINRIDLKNQNPLRNKFFLYPSFIQYIIKNGISYEKQYNMIFESFVVAYLIRNKYLVYKPEIIREDNRNVFYKTFFVIGDNKRFLIKLYLDENEDSLKLFNNIRTVYPKYVLIRGSENPKMDKNGITYLGIERFLKHGIE